MLFSALPDCCVVLRAAGKFWQSPLYERRVDGERHLYAKHVGAFIRLGAEGATSVPRLRWEEPLVLPPHTVEAQDVFGRLSIRGGVPPKQITHEKGSKR